MSQILLCTYSTSIFFIDPFFISRHKQIGHSFFAVRISAEDFFILLILKIFVADCIFFYFVLTFVSMFQLTWIWQKFSGSVSQRVA